jgi:C-terminal processing protease CtpA/Prc
MRKPTSLFVAVFTVILLISLGAPQAKPVAAAAGANAPPLRPSALVRAESPSSQTKTGTQPALLTGSFTYTNEIISNRFTENAVGLMDFHAFVIRDKQWPVPVDGQVLGYLDLDKKAKRAEYRLQLPIRPNATPNDVDNDGRRDAGVQIFVLRFFPNIAGGPFAEGDDVYTGWPTFLTSIIASDADDEVLGGKLIVWSPDNKQEFPSSFGKDGRLFTKDDAVAALPAGWSVIDLDQKPFGIVRDETVDVDLHEPTEIGVKDFSKLSYTEAFKKLVEDARRSYAFNGIAGKEPDWDALLDELLPEVETAEKDKDALAYFLTIRRFVLAFKDGHVSVSVDNNAVSGAYISQYTGGFGLVLRELDDGRVIVIEALEGLPGARAGIVPGAEITRFDGKPIKRAIDETQPLTAPFSSPHSERTEKVKYVLRTEVGNSRTIAFRNPGKAVRTVGMQSEFELRSLFFDEDNASVGLGSTPLPMDFKVIDDKFGYIKINSNNDDLNLFFQLFRRALNIFEQQGIDDVIIDLRYNSGGTGLGLSEFFIDKPMTDIVIPSYFSETEGKFIASDDVTSTLRPKATGFDLDKLAILVSPSCASACEVETQELSRVPGAIVVGHYPTAGIFADVARGQYKLPESISLQMSKIRFTLPNGDLFLEGTGVPPTLRVPMTFDNAMNWKADPVLQAAQKKLK